VWCRPTARRAFRRFAAGRGGRAGVGRRCVRGAARRPPRGEYCRAAGMGPASVARAQPSPSEKARGRWRGTGGRPHARGGPPDGLRAARGQMARQRAAGWGRKVETGQGASRRHGPGTGHRGATGHAAPGRKRGRQVVGARIFMP